MELPRPHRSRESHPLLVSKALKDLANGRMRLWEDELVADVHRWRGFYGEALVVAERKGSNAWKRLETARTTTI